MKYFFLLLFIFPVLVSSGQCWQSISAGGSHTLAIRDDGTLWGWGMNSYGQLADGTTDHRETPILIDGEYTWKMVSAGGFHSLAIREDGSLWGWGFNSSGQAGNGTFGNYVLQPVRIGSGDWIAIEAGQFHSLAIRSDGTLWAWGANFDGQLGIGQQVAYAPVRVGTQTNWRSAAAGGNHSLGIRTDGSLWAWGYNIDGQLGDGTLEDRRTPVQIGSSTDWLSAEAGYNHSLAIKSDGSLWSWGDNQFGQVDPEESVELRNTPGRYGSASWIETGAGRFKSFGIQQDGSVWFWGTDLLGWEHYMDMTPANLDKPAISLSLGDDHVFVEDNSGRFWGWGNGTFGKLGNDSWVDISTPVIQFGGPPEGDPLQIFCFPNPTIADLTVLGTNIKWFDSPAGGNQLPATTELIDGNLYFASQTRADCESITRLQVEVVINEKPAGPAGPSSVTFCRGETLDMVNVTGTDIRWYNEDGYLLNPETTTLVKGRSYFATQTVNYCESDQRMEVRATENLAPVPTTTRTIQSFCYGATLEDFDITGTNLLWYDQETGGNPLPPGTIIINEKLYFVASQENGLISCSRLKVRGKVTDLAAPTGKSRQPFCKKGYVYNLKAGGYGVIFYDVPEGGTKLSASQELQNGTYYAAQTLYGCESRERLKIDVVINKEDTPPPSGDTYQLVCPEGDLSDLVLAGQNISFYDPVGEHGIFHAWPFEHTYHAYQTVDACRSEEYLAVTVDINRQMGPIPVESRPLVARMVTTSTRFSLAIMDDGTLWSWGENRNGSLGYGTTESSRWPKQVGTDNNWEFVDAGISHVLALKSDGTLWAWGGNGTGQQGNSTTSATLSPAQVGTDKDWAMVAAGGAHSLAVKKDGSLWACGNNTYGQTGISPASPNQPILEWTQVDSENDWETVNIHSSGYKSYGLKTDGTLWVWGNEWFPGYDQTEKFKVGSEQPWTAFDVGLDHVLAIKMDGSLWGWGSNEYGQILEPFYTFSDPGRLSEENDWIDVAAGWSFSIAVKSDGTLWGGGKNDSDQLGIPNPVWQEWNNLSEDTDWDRIEAGQYHTFGIKSDGSLWAWGNNRHSQLGDGTAMEQGTPLALMTQDIYTCGIATLAEVGLNAGLMSWYDSYDGGNMLEPSTAIENGAVYYVSQTQNNYESCYRRRVRIFTGNTPSPVPGGIASQTFCHGSRVSDLTADGTHIRWYDSAAGGAPLSGNVSLENGKDYYASQRTDGNCESETRFKVQVTLQAPDSPIAESEQFVCIGSTLSDLNVTGNELQWYTTGDKRTRLAGSTGLIDGFTYFVTQQSDACESQPIGIKVNIKADIPAPEGDSVQVVYSNQFVTDLNASGEAIHWYSSESDAMTHINSLGPSHPLTDGSTFYATQTRGGCESLNALAVTVVVITSLEEDKEETTLFPNPVRDLLQIRSAEFIGEADVINESGQFIKTHAVNGYDATISFEELKSGVYVLRLRSGASSRSFKVIKK